MTASNAVPRRIVGYHQDDVGDWVAELECGHGQHVRHDPPWQARPWVATPEGRAEHLGTVLMCVLCASAEGQP
jgi:tellurite methyltransferase